MRALHPSAGGCGADGAIRATGAQNVRVVRLARVRGGPRDACPRSPGGRMAALDALARAHSVDEVLHRLIDAASSEVGARGALVVELLPAGRARVAATIATTGSVRAGLTGTWRAASRSSRRAARARTGGTRSRGSCSAS